MKRLINCLVLLALGLACGMLPALADDTPSTADFLKQSMSRYQALTSFQAQCGWNETFGGVPQPKSTGDATVRTLIYARPNQFKVVASHSGGRFVQTSVSDGKRLVEYSSMASLPAMTYSAPATIAQAASMQMQHPMFCGSLLYQFFGGPDNLPHLADLSKMPLAYGPDVVVGGEPCKTVLLYTQGMDGHTAIAISPRDHLVRRITYDSAPLMALMAAQSKSPEYLKMLRENKAFQGRKPQMPTSSSTVEEYRQIIVDQPVAAASFDTTLPKGRAVTDMSGFGGMVEGSPPVALGSLAPDCTITRLGGKRPVALSSLRGKVVLLDFWATWCPPCRRSLPETQKLSAAWSGKGLAVLAISDEDPPTISAFVKSNHYTFPAYRDGSKSAGKAYHVSAIPTLAVLDKQGRLVAYFVGLQEPDTVAAALKKAGLPLP